MAFIFKQCCDGRDPIPDPGETGGGKQHGAEAEGEGTKHVELLDGTILTGGG